MSPPHQHPAHSLLRALRDHHIVARSLTTEHHIALSRKVQRHSMHTTLGVVAHHNTPHLKTVFTSRTVRAPPPPLAFTTTLIAAHAQLFSSEPNPTNPSRLTTVDTRDPYSKSRVFQRIAPQRTAFFFTFFLLSCAHFFFFSLCSLFFFFVVLTSSSFSCAHLLLCALRRRRSILRALCARLRRVHRPRAGRHRCRRPRDRSKAKPSRRLREPVA